MFVALFLNYLFKLSFYLRQSEGEVSPERVVRAHLEHLHLQVSPGERREAPLLTPCVPRAEEETEAPPLGKKLLSDFQKDKFTHFFYHVLDLNRDHVISQVNLLSSLLKAE